MMVISSCFSKMVRRNNCISCRVFTSRAPKGSSMRRISGFIIRPRAIATRWSCPPESSGYFAYCSAWDSRPTTLRISIAFAFASSRSTLVISSGSLTFSRTVFHSRLVYCWNTIGTDFLRSFTCPLKRISPEVGVCNPEIYRRRVDLPQPDCPIKVMNWPLLGISGIDKLKSLNTVSPVVS